MFDIQALIDDAEGFATVPTMRRPDGVRRPECQSVGFNKDGRDEARPGGRRHRCHGCGKRLDGPSGTSFAGHHGSLQDWVLCLSFMGLNPSNEQSVHELRIDLDDAHVMASPLHKGIGRRKVGG